LPFDLLVLEKKVKIQMAKVALSATDWSGLPFPQAERAEGAQGQKNSAQM
jgi:hypothetical protein